VELIVIAKTRRRSFIGWPGHGFAPLDFKSFYREGSLPPGNLDKD
jgi:hypothetical protein